MEKNKKMKWKEFVVKAKRKVFYIIEPVISKIIYFFPVKKEKIVVDNFGGKGFGDNPKYIVEELLKQSENIEIIWLVNNLMPKKARKEFPSEIKVRNIDSIMALYDRATAKVWIDNVRHLHPMRKKENQIYLQTWHGRFGGKLVEKDIEHLLGPKYVKAAKYDGKITTGIIVDSKVQEEYFKRSFWLNDKAEMLRFGIPRNDILFHMKDDKEYIERLKKEMNIDKTKYYVLYAPTFRDDFLTDGYKIEFEKVREAFQKVMNRECKIIIRLHPNAAFQKENIRFSKDVIDGTDYPDIQQLALVSDAIISDYSTTIFDFSMLNKPAFVCALDFDEYRQKRGFVKEFYEFPFPFAKTNNELIQNIENYRKDEYNKKINKYFDENPVYDKGDAAIKTAQWIINKM